MTIPEFLVLVKLFQACADPALRRWAVERVPELAEWDKPAGGRIIDKREPPRLVDLRTNLTQEDVDRIPPR